MTQSISTDQTPCPLLQQPSLLQQASRSQGGLAPKSESHKTPSLGKDEIFLLMAAGVGLGGVGGYVLSRLLHSSEGHSPAVAPPATNEGQSPGVAPPATKAQAPPPAKSEAKMPVFDGTGITVYHPGWSIRELTPEPPREHFI